MGVGYGRSANLWVGICLAAVCWITGSSGCGPRVPREKVSLESPDSAVRVLAIVRTANDRDQSAVPQLVDRLEDEDRAVRFYAILALDALTGTRLGYKYGGPEVERRASVERWRRYLVESWDGGGASRAAEH